MADERFRQAELASTEIDAHLPQVLERYKDQLSAHLRDSTFDMPLLTIEILSAIGLSAVKEQPGSTVPEQLDQLEPEGRDECEALEAAAPDLIRLQRYERRAWSRQKRAICNFANLKLMRAMTTAAKEEKGPARPS